MLKKRMIFTLLYSNEYFMLSRNFRLQKVGNLKWLETNYNFSKISDSIDELIILDVTRGEKSLDKFCSTIRKLTAGCFVPISAGGGVKNIKDAYDLLRSGADKVVINSQLYKQNGLISRLASEFGQQCIVASMDLKLALDGSYQVWSECGSRRLEDKAAKWIDIVIQNEVGELYLNSIDRDGTGQGYDFGLLDLLPNNMPKPVILAGGVGNAAHFAEGLADNRVDAVATANLFNFIGDGLRNARSKLISSGIDLPFWDAQLVENQFKQG